MVTTSSFTTQIGHERFEVQCPWHGVPLNGPYVPYVAIDTEFEPNTERLALVGASSTQHAVLYPSQLPDLLDVHPEAVWVMHNAACDWWVIHDNLPPPYRSRWVDAVHQGRVRDTMILDMLVRLASGEVRGGSDDDEESSLVPRGLEKIAGELTALSKNSDDPYRMRYGEIIGKEFSGVDPGFLHYASHDPIVTLRCYLHLYARGVELMRRHGYSPRRTRHDKPPIRPDAIGRFGVLSELIQVEGAIALRSIERLGIGLNKEMFAETDTRLREEVGALEQYIIDNHPDVLPPVYSARCRKNVPGTRPRTATGCLSLTDLIPKFEEIGKRLDVPVPRSGGKLGRTSTSAKDWVQYADRDPFVRAYCELKGKTKLLGYVKDFIGRDRVYPRYSILKVTGRTSCYSPNLQQQPKGEWRKHFVPAPGYRLFVGDLSGAELCTFAAFARLSYGRSVMGDQLEAGRNVHAFFAAKILGMEYGEFMTLKKTDPKRFAEQRQVAKPANFGLMGGMGAEKFRMYAGQPPYNVHLSLRQAEELVELWEDTFPEGKLHRSNEPEVRCLARNLGCDPRRVREWLRDKEGWYFYVVEKVVRGEAKKNGDDYSAYLKHSVWSDLISLCEDPELLELLSPRRGSALVHSRLFRRDVCSITGRIYGDVRYTVLRNYPFQSLAADIKRGLFRLVAQGVRVVGFVHDELLIEVRDEDEGKRVAATVEDAMNEVMGQKLTTVEWHLSEAWVKP